MPEKRINHLKSGKKIYKVHKLVFLQNVTLLTFLNYFKKARNTFFGKNTPVVMPINYKTRKCLKNIAQKKQKSLYF